MLLQLRDGLCEVPPLRLEYLGLEASLLVLRAPEGLGYVNLVNFTLHVGLLFDLDLL